MLFRIIVEGFYDRGLNALRVILWDANTDSLINQWFDYIPYTMLALHYHQARNFAHHDEMGLRVARCAHIPYYKKIRPYYNTFTENFICCNKYA
jgi:hypothetical protein